MNWLAFDVGGANLKLADGLGFARQEPFALWRQPDQLADRLSEMIASAPPVRHIAATMTGELADCFSTKAEGVARIVQALEQACCQHELFIYLTNGMLAPPAQAVAQPLLAAASNWHALASFARRFITVEVAVLIDIGSTTSDLIPIVSGQLAPLGYTDPQRLVSGELVYSGVVRSPVCAVVQQLIWRGQPCPVAQELFATMLDAYLWLRCLPEDPTFQQTADGRPATRDAARDRLARAVCADRTSFSEEDATASAQQLQAAQLNRLRESLAQLCQRLPRPPQQFLICGQGEFLARHLAEGYVGASLFSLSKELGNSLSQVAPAHALAVLAREQFP